MINPDLEEQLKEIRSLDTYEPKSTINAEKIKLNKEEFIFFPQHKVYVAREVELKNYNWHEAEIETHNRKARILNLREFVDFLLFLKSETIENGLGNKLSKSEILEIYEKIIYKKGKYRAELLNTRFVESNEGFNIHNFDSIINPDNVVKLEPCLMEDSKVNLKSFNNQGMPAEKGRDISYHCPKNNVRKSTAAIFYASYHSVGLDCNVFTYYSSPDLGSRLVYEQEFFQKI